MGKLSLIMSGEMPHAVLIDSETGNEILGVHSVNVVNAGNTPPYLVVHATPHQVLINSEQIAPDVGDEAQARGDEPKGGRTL